MNIGFAAPVASIIDANRPRRKSNSIPHDPCIAMVVIIDPVALLTLADPKSARCGTPVIFFLPQRDNLYDRDITCGRRDAGAKSRAPPQDETVPNSKKEDVMRWKFLAVAIAAAVVINAGSLPVTDKAHAACDVGDKIDRSTVGDARKKIETAGYRNIRDLRKGCDNYWHASAEKDGVPVLVVLSPQGEVMQEGD